MIGDPRNGIVQAMMQQQQQPQMQQVQQQRRMPFARQAQQSMSGPASAGTQDMAAAYNAAAGPASALQGGQGQLGGNLGLLNTLDPSMWNTSLPSGSLTGV